MKKLIVANWKMNGSKGLLAQFLATADSANFGAAEVVLCPPFPFLSITGQMTTKNLKFGAQDCSEMRSGARTGEVSAGILKEFGASHCLVGHSERRPHLSEENKVIHGKLVQLQDCDLTPILCVGETRERRDDNTWRDVIAQQLSILPVGKKKPIIIAYEPIWAIGAGRLPTSQEIDETMAFVRGRLDCLGFISGKQRVLYGGSADEKNAAMLLSLSNVDGLLVGGASLDPIRFAKIVGKAVDTNWDGMRN